MTLNYIPSRSVVLRVPFYKLGAESKNKPALISQNSDLKYQRINSSSREPQYKLEKGNGDNIFEISPGAVLPS